MPRPYRDPVEIVTKPLEAKGPLIPADATMMVGVIGAVSPDPLPLVLFSGYEYHITEWIDEQNERHWILERRVAATTKRAYVQLPDDGTWLGEPGGRVDGASSNP